MNLIKSIYKRDEEDIFMFTKKVNSVTSNLLHKILIPWFKCHIIEG